MENSFIILLQLLLAHIINDFVFQPSGWIKHKRRYKGRSYILVLHSLLAGILSLLFLQSLEYLYAAALISVTHYFIDWWKLLQKKDNLKYFLLDQLFHFLVILIVWLFIISSFDLVIPVLLELINSPVILAVISGYLIVIFPAGFLIGKATHRWQKEIEPSFQTNSLASAGRYIGIFERILVLTFILTNNFAAIGFLIAAKSILRFNEKSETGARKQTEYVLIGTLMSFSITILLGLFINYLVF